MSFGRQRVTVPKRANMYRAVLRTQLQEARDATSAAEVSLEAECITMTAMLMRVETSVRN